MRGLVKHEKRNMLIITLAFTIVVLCYKARLQVILQELEIDIFMTTMGIYFWERSISIMNHLL